ncbi:MAG: hypothetical protein JXA90_16440, partial [Planctomycetes bacterium]|nr:hypothetical protein [Planctomycetota bacterium]
FGDDLGDWITPVIIVLFVVGGLVQAAVQAFSRKSQQAGRGAGEPRGRRSIHDVLDEIRREVEERARAGGPAEEAGEVEGLRPDRAGGGAAPPRPPRHAPQRAPQQRPAAVRPPGRTAEAAWRDQRSRPSGARPPARPSATRSESAGRFGGLGEAYTGGLQPLSDVSPSALRALARPAWATPDEAEVSPVKAVPRLLGMDLRQMVLAQVILGPPPILQRMRARRGARPGRAPSRP